MTQARWIAPLGAGLGALASGGMALLAGFAAILIGSDEALAARPYQAAFLILAAVTVALLVGAGLGVVRALTQRR